MRDLLLAEHSLLIRPNTIGWTSLHFCASSPEITFDTWTWILQRVPQGFDILNLRTDSGQNCVDHFFRLFLNPLEWQRHEVKQAANGLKESIRHCLKDRLHLQLLQQALVDDSNAFLCNQHVARILPFWKRLQVLMLHISESSLMHALARTACPKEVALLAMRLFPSQINLRDSAGNLPLHLACQHESADVIMECLLDQASFPDGHGRLPLHIALSTGAKTWDNGVDRLWNAFPQYGGARDVETGFPAFLLAALPDPAVQHRATKRLAADTSGSLWRFMPSVSQKQGLAEAKLWIGLQHLSTVYQVLRAAPNVLSCCL